ncbi:winged helix-turn-helix domain-containing protein [Desulfococcaceae bacterium OttesenSCG-928-F15]|nr:winged helix-turn-helix domain-containing protein [Desulfococcaceae bacterium OttesenSCG-928-F15]
MARPVSGQEILAQAQKQLLGATTLKELRILQAVVFPLVNEMTLSETAAAIGRSHSWVTKARNAYIRNGGFPKQEPRIKRNRAKLSSEEEAAFLAPFFEHARNGGILIVNEIHEALEKHLGHKVSLATAYNLLHRQGWRKLAPNKRNVAADIEAQEEWKKNCRKSSARLKKVGKVQASSS